MTKKELIAQIRSKKSCLCIGLDPDPAKIPTHLMREENPVLAFNKAIIDATSDLCVAYKPNLAFYEALGEQGWHTFIETVKCIPDTHFIIADAKRGDIGNTSGKYATAFFQQMSCDAITIAPYMGQDSVKPFLGFDGKWVILLGLTSNPGSEDFQMLRLENGQSLYEQVLKVASSWGTTDELMFVIGATHLEYFKQVRSIIPDHFLLVPGVGAQGGNLEAVLKYGRNKDIGLLINSSRGIIYAGTEEDFAQQARAAALSLQQGMAAFI